MGRGGIDAKNGAAPNSEPGSWLGDEPFSIVDRMKQLYSARNALEAHDLRFFLAAHDIDAKVTGDNNAFETFISFTPQSAPCVFVDDADFERAAEVLVQFVNRRSSPESQPAWTCSKCQQIVESQFDTCWKCSTPREEALSKRDFSPPIDDGEDEKTPQVEATAD